MAVISGVPQGPMALTRILGPFRIVFGLLRDEFLFALLDHSMRISPALIHPGCLARLGAMWLCATIFTLCPASSTPTLLFLGTDALCDLGVDGPHSLWASPLGGFLFLAAPLSTSDARWVPSLQMLLGGVAIKMR